MTEPIPSKLRSTPDAPESDRSAISDQRSAIRPEPLLELREVHAGYGPIKVLRSVSLTVGVGEIVTLIGANGAGKTTTLMACSGVVRATSGAIRFAGAPIHGLPAHRIVGLGLAHVPEGRRIFPRLSVLENLRLGAFLRRDDPLPDLERLFALFPILAERRQQPGGTLSGGEQQMLAIARALMSRPRLLLMDEPSMGVAPKLVLAIFAAIRQLNRDGLAVLLVEQNASLALGLADRGYVMETGRIVATDRAAALLGNPEVRRAYLGG